MRLSSSGGLAKITPDPLVAGGWSRCRREAGAFLGEQVFRPGQSLRWDRLIEATTGEPLTATHAARDIAAGLAT